MSSDARREGHAGRSSGTPAGKEDDRGVIAGLIAKTSALRSGTAIVSAVRGRLDSLRQGVAGVTGSNNSSRVSPIVAQRDTASPHAYEGESYTGQRKRSSSLPDIRSWAESADRPTEPESTLTWAGLRARASAIDLPNLDFHFRFPFFEGEDKSPKRPLLTKDPDQRSLTSLEFESLLDSKGMENNRLRAVIEGIGPKLPTLGDKPFAGLSKSTGDVNIVVMGGYRGSILRSAVDGRMLWVPIKVGLGIRKVDLQLGLEDEAEQGASKVIAPDGMLTHIGPVDISRRLLKRLRENEALGYCRVHEYGYDWRLSGHTLSQGLQRHLEKLEGKTIVIAHSLGGLITMHAMNERPDLFSGVLLAGTPCDGAVAILGPFRNGDSVLLNRDILNAATCFSMRSSFLLLPLHGRCFVDESTGKEIQVDLLDHNEWRKYGLSPEVALDRGASDEREGVEVNAQLATAGVGGPAFDGGAKESSKDESETTRRRRVQRSCEYLERTLERTKQFRAELTFRPEIDYPPIAILRSRDTPTVRGCRLNGEAGIKAGQYDHFVMTPGDGVVAYTSADPREMHDRAGLSWNGAYPVVKDVATERGHIGLLGDVKAVEECLQTLLAEMKPGSIRSQRTAAGYVQ